MFDKIIKFFTKAQEIKNKRFEDFEKFHIECIKTFPNDLKVQLRKCNIKPVSVDLNLEKITGNKHSNWIMGFTSKDILWWREEYKNDNFTMLSIDMIKNKVRQECLNIIENMPIGELDDETRDIYNNILEESLEN